MMSVTRSVAIIDSAGARGAALSLALLAACSSSSPPRPDDTEVRQFAGRGYLTDDHFSTSATLASWFAGGGGCEVSLTVPVAPGPFPLVIYLPALGETREAGPAWRRAWAEGGYAVVAIQPLAEDAGAWASARARAGDFAALARERYAADAMTARLQALAGALGELKRRHDRGEAPLDRIDLSRVAVAGYDLGAYTAMVIAGESLRGPAVPKLPVPVSAVIALSPYADFSGAPFSERYSAIRPPVLSVTGASDGDPLASVSSPSVRRAPFRYMPPGDKFLLDLVSVTHRTLAGATERPEFPAGSDAAESPDETGATPQSGRGGRRRDVGGQGGPGGDSGAGSEGRGRRVAGAAGTRAAATAQAIDAAAVQHVTLSFLDAYVKNDPVAREWLARDAPRWLKGRGEVARR
jgi:hypothetical protein